VLGRSHQSLNQQAAIRRPQLYQRPKSILLRLCLNPKSTTLALGLYYIECGCSDYNKCDSRRLHRLLSRTWWVKTPCFQDPRHNCLYCLLGACRRQSCNQFGQLSGWVTNVHVSTVLNVGVFTSVTQFACETLWGLSEFTGKTACGAHL
jgi:hypothetical protein